MIDTKTAMRVLEAIESNAKDGRSNCSRKWISTAAKCNRDEVDRYVRYLNELGFLKRLTSNLYEVKR